MDQPERETTLKKPSIFRILMVVLVVIVVVAAIAAAVMFFNKGFTSSTASTDNSNSSGQEENARQFNTSPGTAPVDADTDGLTDDEERTLGTNPAEADTDHDELTDFDEVRKYHTDPKKPSSGTLAITDGEAVKQGIDPLTGKKLFANVPPANVNN